MSADKKENAMVLLSEASSGQAMYELFDEVLRKGISLRVQVTGRSMMPFLKGGEILTIRKTTCSSLYPGDLIFYRDGDGLPILHRIILKKKDHNGMLLFHTKGDSLIAFDEPVGEDRLLGKVCTVEKADHQESIQSINMESARWRTINYCIAILSRIKSKTYLSILRLRRCIGICSSPRNNPS